MSVRPDSSPDPVVRHYYLALEPQSAGPDAQWGPDQSVARGRHLVTLSMAIRSRLDLELSGDDWFHVGPDFMKEFFDDLACLTKLARHQTCEIIALAQEPMSECADDAPSPEFRFAGYEIAGRFHDHSLLLDFGPSFPRAFKTSDLNELGLLPTLAQATAAKARLLLHYSAHPHVVGCSVWAIWVQTEHV